LTDRHYNYYTIYTNHSLFTKLDW